MSQRKDCDIFFIYIASNQNKNYFRKHYKHKSRQGAFIYREPTLNHDQRGRLPLTENRLGVTGVTGWIEGGMKTKNKPQETTSAYRSGFGCFTPDTKR